MMEDWKEYKIKDIAKIVGGYAFKSKDFSSNNKIPIIKIKSIKNKNIIIEGGDFVDEMFLELDSKFHIEYNDIVIALTGSHITLPSSAVGRVAKSRHKRTLLLNQRVGKFVVNKKNCNHDFLYYILITDYFFESIGLRARGAANQANISGGDVENIKVNLPPLPTQQKIATILSAYDDLIENNLKRIKLLEEKAQQTYEQWFVRLKFPGHETTPINPETGLPDGWEKGKILNLFELQRGFDLPVQNRISGEIPVLSSTGIIAYHNEYKVKGPGIVTGRSGTIGDVQYVMDDYWPLNTTLWIKKYNKGNPSFALQFLRIINLKRFAGGSAVPSLNRNVVHHQSIKIPPVKLMDEYEIYCNPILKSIKNLQVQINHFKEARNILLPRLMTGMIDVDKLDIKL